MPRGRREVLKTLCAAGAAVALRPPRARASAAPVSDEGVGLLYDATRCVGCKACAAACKRANDMPAERAAFDEAGLWDAPSDLSGSTRTVIQLYEGPEGRSFVKRQCMHCEKPACASACPVSAMERTASGAVVHDPGRCIGCRYCMVACPFNVPRFQWGSAAPRIVKCDLCFGTALERDGRPACASACPAGAVSFGTRSGLLAEARRRLAAEPGRYQPRIYGETEVGGTRALVLSAVPFERLGLPTLPDRSYAALSETIQHGIYRGFAAPVALYAGLFWLARRNRRRSERKGGDHGDGPR